jgi:hypothetical protein
MDALTVAKDYGVPLLILLGLYRIWRINLWPFLTDQVKAWQADRKAERDSTSAERRAEREAFISSLAGLQTVTAEGHAATAERDRIIAEQIESMAKSVQQIVVLVQQCPTRSNQPSGSAHRRRVPVVN